MQNENKGYAGNLLEEVDEIRKTVLSDEVIEIAMSTTMGCGAVLTIYCCYRARANYWMRR